METRTTLPKQLTLCYIRDGKNVLLGMKKTGFGAGYWNGFGGKVHDGETTEHAAIREVQEECGLVVASLELYAQLIFTFDEHPDTLHVAVYIATDFSGTPIETEEMRPMWFSLDAVPYQKMWPDDEIWLPRILNGEKLHGTFHFDQTEKMLLHSEIKPL